MKSITETIGGAQVLLDIPYELQGSFEEYLTDEYKTFVSVKLSGGNVPGEQFFPVFGRFGVRAAFKKRP
jgi:hypothetical protein